MPTVKAMAGEVTAEPRCIFGRQVDGTHDKAETVRQRIREVRAAEASDWDRLKKGSVQALDDPKRSVDNTVQWLRKTGSENR